MKLLKDVHKRNRAFVVLRDGTKIHYGTLTSCYKFMEHMKGSANNGNGKVDK